MMPESSKLNFRNQEKNGERRIAKSIFVIGEEGG
jgi:hypothetical protein